MVLARNIFIFEPTILHYSTTDHFCNPIHHSRYSTNSSTENITVEYPVGHRRRRQEAKPLLVDKFRANLSTQLDKEKVEELVKLFSDQSILGLMAVDDLVDMLVPAGD